MGLSPYINASIIIQLMTVVIPKLEALVKRGYGRTKEDSIMYTRIADQSHLHYASVLRNDHPSQFKVHMEQVFRLISDVTDPMVVIPIMIIVTGWYSVPYVAW